LAQLERLASHITVRSTQKYQIVFDQEQKTTFVYILLSGVMRIS
jgi:CRP-like cAMP-binding protein